MHYLCQRPYLIMPSVNQSSPRAVTSTFLLPSTVGDKTPSETVKTQRTCGIPVIMQLSGLHLRLMEAKTKKNGSTLGSSYRQSDMIHVPRMISRWRSYLPENVLLSNWGLEVNSVNVWGAGTKLIRIFQPVVGGLCSAALLCAVSFPVTDIDLSMLFFSVL